MSSEAVDSTTPTQAMRASRRQGVVMLCCLVFALLGGILLYRAFLAEPSLPTDAIPAARPPRLQPMVAGVTLPPNIAPVNFRVEGERGALRVRVVALPASDADASPTDLGASDPVGAGRAQPATKTEEAREGEGATLRGEGGVLRIPEATWRRLLGAHPGGLLRYTVYAQQSDGTWRRYAPFTQRIATAPVDRYLTYRLIDPGHQFWRSMGIYERDLTTFAERRVLHNASFRDGCVNCHVPARDGGGTSVMHVRGTPGSGIMPGMLVLRGAEAAYVDTRTSANPAPASFCALHPSGKAVAFAALGLRQYFMTHGDAREVFEYAADLGVYRLDRHAMVGDARISRPDHCETYPAWSGDGRFLYFSRTPITWSEVEIEENRLPDNYRSVRYDLCRVSYDLATDTFGPVETILAAETVNRSLVQSAVSPDGRFVVVSALPYGMWPVTKAEADLLLYDTQTRAHRDLACNSDHSESYHDWSSNGRWLVFASKRRDGLLTRLYLTRIDAQGRSTPALEVPQADPGASAAFLKVYNVPRFATQPIQVDEADLARRITETTAPPKPDIRTGASPPWEPKEGTPPKAMDPGPTQTNPTTQPASQRRP